MTEDGIFTLIYTDNRVRRRVCVIDEETDTEERTSNDHISSTLYCRGHPCRSYVHTQTTCRHTFDLTYNRSPCLQPVKLHHSIKQQSVGLRYTVTGQ